MQKKKAIVLVSGGLDSATTLAIATHQGYDCYALSFHYGQRHVAELRAASAICRVFGVKEHQIYHLNLNLWGGSALTDEKITVPTAQTSGIPVTYVPARNTIFLSLALAWAEAISAFDIFIGVNAVDYSGYPDCRPEFIAAFQKVAQLGTKVGVEGQRALTIHTPLITCSKQEIIQKGLELGVDYSLTVSCYQADPEGAACGVCDSCRIRKSAFLQLGVSDPTCYHVGI